MLLKNPINQYVENGVAYFVEEGGSLLNSSYAYVICNEKGEAKAPISVSDVSYSKREKHATFVIEKGDFILGGERVGDKTTYCIHECTFKDAEFIYAGSLLFTKETAHMFITPRFLKPFNALNKKMDSHQYGPVFIKSA